MQISAICAGATYSLPQSKSTSAPCPLTDEAFQTLLPAFLFHALFISEENKFLEWTLYALCGPHEEDQETTEAADTYLRRRIAEFTDEQRAAMRAFMALVTEAPDLAFHHEPIAHAISAIWTEAKFPYRRVPPQRGGTTSAMVNRRRPACEFLVFSR